MVDWSELRYKLRSVFMNLVDCWVKLNIFVVSVSDEGGFGSGKVFWHVNKIKNTANIFDQKDFVKCKYIIEDHQLI